MPSKFAILHHRLEAGEHWDLMLERGDVLLTWRLTHDPTAGSNLSIPAKRIGDHRKAYLEYEGPVSGGRGHVRRIDAGTVKFQQITANGYIFQLEGERLSGRYRITTQGHECRFFAESG